MTDWHSSDSVSWWQEQRWSSKHWFSGHSPRDAYASARKFYWSQLWLHA